MNLKLLVSIVSSRSTRDAEAGEFEASLVHIAAPEAEEEEKEQEAK